MLVATAPSLAAQEIAVMDVGDALAMPRPEPDRLIRYGPQPQQFGELRLPVGPGPHPVAVVVHGGCWLAEYDLGYMSALSAQLAAEGVATWNVEYRRVGDAGGGWPGTFHDVGAAADALRRLARDHDLDINRVVVLGHSAGGHLALWLAGRHRLPADDPLRGQQPLAPSGVVSLAGIPDLAGYASPEGCGAAVPRLLGGIMAEGSSRLRRTSPIAMVPLESPQVLVIGQNDPIVPRDQADRYLAAAVKSGDRIRLEEIPGAGHFELVNPASAAWPTVSAAVRDLLESAVDLQRR